MRVQITLGACDTGEVYSIIKPHLPPNPASPEGHVDYRVKVRTCY